MKRDLQIQINKVVQKSSACVVCVRVRVHVYVFRKKLAVSPMHCVNYAFESEYSFLFSVEIKNNMSGLIYLIADKWCFWELNKLGAIINEFLNVSSYKNIYKNSNHDYI